jgi:hypothetical protein
LAFLASLIRLGPEGFEYEQCLPLIVGKLVSKSDEEYADAIQGTVLGANRQSPIANRGAFGKEAILLANCAQTFGLEKLGLSQITLETLTQITGQLTSAADNSVGLSELF